MRTIKIKEICDLTNSHVHVGLQHPHARPGQFGLVRTVEITDVPDSVPSALVIKAWRETADISYLATGQYRRHSYQYSEIGNGRILR